MLPIREKRLVEIIDKAIKDFHGNSQRLSNTIGYLMLDRKFGWRVMLLMYGRKSIKDYEKIPGVDSRIIFPEHSPLKNNSMAYRAL